MKAYNKLVRDKIPDIISEQGLSCDFRMLTDAEYLEALDKKLDEELAEYHESGNIEELADLLEVIYAIGIAKKCSIGSLDQIRLNKIRDRGSFNRKIMLLSVRGDGNEG